MIARSYNYTIEIVAIIEYDEMHFNKLLVLTTTMKTLIILNYISNANRIH